MVGEGEGRGGGLSWGLRGACPSGAGPGAGPCRLQPGRIGTCACPGTATTTTTTTSTASTTATTSTTHHPHSPPPRPPDLEVLRLAAELEECQVHLHAEAAAGRQDGHVVQHAHGLLGGGGAGVRQRQHLLGQHLRPGGAGGGGGSARRRGARQQQRRQARGSSTGCSAVPQPLPACSAAPIPAAAPPCSGPAAAAARPPAALQRPCRAGRPSPAWPAPMRRAPWRRGRPPRWPGSRRWWAARGRPSPPVCPPGRWLPCRPPGRRAGERVVGVGVRGGVRGAGCEGQGGGRALWGQRARGCPPAHACTGIPSPSSPQQPPAAPSSPQQQPPAAPSSPLLLHPPARPPTWNSSMTSSRCWLTPETSGSGTSKPTLPSTMNMRLLPCSATAPQLWPLRHISCTTTSWENASWQKERTCSKSCGAHREGRRAGSGPGAGQRGAARRWRQRLLEPCAPGRPGAASPPHPGPGPARARAHLVLEAQEVDGAALAAAHAQLAAAGQLGPVEAADLCGGRRSAARRDSGSAIGPPRAAAPPAPRAAARARRQAARCRARPQPPAHLRP
jgi:hypothetical protein